ncbi:MAG TPA: DUF4338 domain-containing protein [Verrucomicrobiota bacterium]|nr:DUF4338 domain-containing protein [Verrucomicrobiota bacterium]
MISTNHELFSADPPVSFLKNLKVRALEPEEYQRAGELLDREHYLGDVPQGRQLLQAVEYAGQWVALLDWGPATWKLADREEWIGWTPQLNCNLSALRICLIALKADLHPEASWPALQERCQNNPQIPFQILVKHRSTS